jgi:hypothetical protein
VLVSLAPMLAPLGAKVAVVLLLLVVVLAPPASTIELPFVAVFCGRQSDWVTFVPPAGPTDAPPGACVTAVSLLTPVVCTG